MTYIFLTSLTNIVIILLYILDAYTSQVLDKDMQMKRMRISGVPFFIIENQNGGKPFAFSGAQVLYVCYVELLALRYAI